MPILRKPKQNNFAQISNGVTQNEKLSWKARGILCYLLSKPEGWKVQIADLERASEKDKKDSLRSGLKELENEGFLEWSTIRGDGGRFDSFLDIFEEPLPENLRKKNVRGSLAFIAEGGFSAENSGNVADFPLESTVADFPLPSKTEENAEMPVIITENKISEESSNAENPLPSNSEDQPLRINRNGKPATDLIRNVSNTEVINKEEISNDISIVAEMEKNQKKTFLDDLDEKQILDLRKSISGISYQKRGAVKQITSEEWQSIASVFNFWVNLFNLKKSTRLTPERGRAVLNRLRSTAIWTAEDIKTGIFGNSKSPHHSGNNDRGTTYHDLELICRTDQHLAAAIGYAEAFNELEEKKNGYHNGNGTNGKGINSRPLNGSGGNDFEDEEAALASIGIRRT